jgi:hypothetical protein
MAAATVDDRSPPEVLADRRRPGRVDYQHEQLLALLRDQPTKTNPAPAEAAVPRVRWTDDLSPARGILVGVPIGAAIWAAIVFAIWCLS